MICNYLGDRHVTPRILTTAGRHLQPNPQCRPSRKRERRTKCTPHSETQASNLSPQKRCLTLLTFSSCLSSGTSHLLPLRRSLPRRWQPLQPAPPPPRPSASPARHPASPAPSQRPRRCSSLPPQRLRPSFSPAPGASPHQGSSRPPWHPHPSFWPDPWRRLRRCS